MYAEDALQLLDAIAAAVDASRDPDAERPDVFDVGQHLGRTREEIAEQAEWLSSEGYVKWTTTHWVELLPLGRMISSRRTGGGRLRR